MSYHNIDFNQDHFVLPVTDYSRDIDPIKHYIEQQAQFLSIMESIPKESALDFIKSNIQKEGLFPITNPKVKCLLPDTYGDRQKEEMTLLSYLKRTTDNEEVLTATFTTYQNQDKAMSYISEYVDYQIPKRKKLKKAQFKFKQEGNVNGEAFANNGQNNIKRSINGISGASSISSTPIYSASLHPVLTSTCRMTSGYANANNEKLIGGNRHYHNADITLNNLVALTTHIDEDRILSVIGKFNLKIPSVDEIMEVILRSTRLYWHWPEKEQMIKEFLSKCNQAQLASIIYTYDLWSMRKFNHDFVADFLLKLSKRCEPISEMTIDEAQSVFKSAKESIRNIGIQINAEKVKGLKEDQYFNTETIRYISACIVNIYQTYEEYKDYITTFLRTNHMPSSLARFPSSLRRVVIMSDTDSSMFTTQDWTNWLVKLKNDESIRFPVFANIVGIIDATLSHLLSIMSSNLGVTKKKLRLISMKNEFSFDTMAVQGLTKHYFASINYQEGNVYSKLSIEKKGVHLKNSNSPVEIIQHAEDIMKRLYNIYDHDKRIKLYDILKEIADVERKIFEKVDVGDVEYYRSKQIKDEEAYKKDGESSPYAHYTFWNETFGKFYGETQPPPYGAFDVKLAINNKTQMKAFLDSFKNQELANLIRQNMQRRNKEIIATINIPYEIFIGRSIPEEIIPWVAKRDLVANICMPYYIALGAVGIAMQDNHTTKLISDFY